VGQFSSYDLPRLFETMSHRFQTVVRFQAVEPDRQISRIRLSDKTSRLHPRQAAPNRTGLHQLGLADAPGARPVVPHPRKTHRQRDGDGVRLCRGFLRLGLHSGLSSLSISALATAVAFSMACSRVRVLGLNRRETRLSQ